VDIPEPLSNADVDWDDWPVQEYLAEVYRELHPSDDAVITHHAAFYRRIPAGDVRVSLELGAGPNLYPLMLAASVSPRIEVLEPSAPSVAYLRRQLRDGADPSWQPFYRRCRELLPALPPSLDEALARVEVRQGSAADLELGRYDLASMHFVAESVTELPEEFAAVCAAFTSSVRPGGWLVAAFMENMGRYTVGRGPHWPGYPVDQAIVRGSFADLVSELETARTDFDTTGPDYGYTGMVMLTARR
jgi:hypothetical protein